MKITKGPQSERVSVYMSGVDPGDVNELAGMLRGLACSLDGFRADKGMDNQRFWTEEPVIWEFSDADKASYFVECVKYYFSDDILETLKVKRRYYRR